MTRAGTPQGYHVFEYAGWKFVYHVASGRFWKVDDLAYRLLSLLRGSRSLDEAARTLVDLHGHPAADVASVCAELKSPALAGLFRTPVLRMPDEQVEKELASRYRVPWTKIELALAETCNLACTYCYNEACPDLPRRGVMSRAVAKEAIDWLFRASEGRQEIGITLFGGEPLLNKRTFSFVMDYSDELARKHGKKIRYTMTTNGTLLDDEAVSYIKRHNFGLMVSLDGPVEIQDGQRPTVHGEGSFAAAERGIRKLMARRRRVTVRCTMTRSRPRMLDLIRFFEEFGFTRIVLGKAMNPSSPSPVDCDRETMEEFARQEEDDILPWIFDQLERGRKPAYFPYGSTIDGMHGASGPPVSSVANCGACRGTMTVGADGTLYPCHRYVGMSPFRMGNIRSGPDLEAGSAFWRDFHRAQSKCDACWARHLCQRPCAWEVSRATGGFDAQEEWKCRLTRRAFERGAYVYFRMLRDHPWALEGSSPPPASARQPGARPGRKNDVFEKVGAAREEAKS